MKLRNLIIIRSLLGIFFIRLEKYVNNFYHIKFFFKWYILSGNTGLVHLNK